MSRYEYASDVDELLAIQAKIAESETKGSAPPSREDAALIARLVYIAIKLVLVVDRGNNLLPTEYPRRQVAMTYTARGITVMAALTAIMFVASVPLLFMDRVAAIAAFLISFAMLGITALLIIVVLWLTTRSGGSPRRNGRFVGEVAGAVGRLAAGIQ